MNNSPTIFVIEVNYGDGSGWEFYDVAKSLHGAVILAREIPWSWRILRGKPTRLFLVEYPEAREALKQADLIEKAMKNFAP